MRNTYGFAQIVQKMPKFFSFHLQNFVKIIFRTFRKLRKTAHNIIAFHTKKLQKSLQKNCAKMKSFRENPVNRSKNKNVSGVHHH